MSKFDDANSEPTYIVPEEVDEVEVAETAYVVPEEVAVPEPVEVVEETTYRVDPTYQTSERQYIAPVAETRPFWSRFWWLIPLLGLLIALPFILRGCNREHQACTSVPDSVFTAAAQTSAVQELDGWITGIAADHTPAAITALRNLCNARLSHTGAGNWYDNNAIQGAFSAFAPDLEPNVITNIQNLVNGNTFCRCS